MVKYNSKRFTGWAITFSQENNYLFSNNFCNKDICHMPIHVQHPLIYFLYNNQNLPNIFSTLIRTTV